MPKQIIRFSNQNKLSVFLVSVSNDWFSLTPWEHDGKIVKYFDKVTEIKQDKTTIRFVTYYLGPFSVVFAKVLEK